MENDTIIALSSGHVRAGVSVLRISGPHAFLFLSAYVPGQVLPTRTASLRWIIDESGRKLDQALVLRFEAPNSFTGEHLLEIHCHGSFAVIDEVIRIALLLDRYRVAEPGEFSKRAFENGKLDLIQAEGIADIIDATAPAQLHQAARFVAGDASARIADWRKRILEASAYLAASIDFSDEGDVGESAHEPVRNILMTLVRDFEASIQAQKSASRVRDGIRIAIIGEPNVGKSTLMNVLAERDAAIVSDIAGTTRDILEVSLVLEGVPVILADTAGLRDTDDPIEREGVRRARAWAETADLRLYLLPCSSRSVPDNVSFDFLIGTKRDEIGQTDPKLPFDVVVSATTGENIDMLRDLLGSEVRRLTGQNEAPSIVRARHLVQMSNARESIQRTIDLLELYDDVDLAAFELSLAASALDQILGRVDVEDILGEVFSGFCVGK